MQELIKDLLAYSRVTSRGEAFKPVHCEGVVQHAFDNLKTAIEESGVKIRLPEKSLPMVMGNKTQLIQPSRTSSETRSSFEVNVRQRYRSV